MSSDLVTTIIVGIIGFIMVSLFSIIGWFIVKSFSTIEQNMEKHASSIGELAMSIKDLSGIIRTVQNEMTIRHAATETILKEHHESVELVRTRVHYVFGKLGVLKFRYEIMGKLINDICEKVGMKPFKYEFSDKEWEMPSMPYKEYLGNG